VTGSNSGWLTTQPVNVGLDITSSICVSLCETRSSWFCFHGPTGRRGHLAELGLDAYVLRVDTFWVMAAVTRMLSLIQQLSYAVVVVVSDHRDNDDGPGVLAWPFWTRCLTWTQYCLEVVLKS